MDMASDITGVGQTTPVKYFFSWIAWPLLFAICVAITAYGFSIDHSHLYFNLAYGFLIFSLFFLERWMPHEAQWQASDGQFWADILHTLTSKGTVQALLVANGLIGVSDHLEGSGLFSLHLWPTSWPLFLQISLALVASEFMLYWAHRGGHEYLPLWRFHAIHHSVEKLWIVNTGRFHFVDSLYSIILGLIPLVLLGAPMDMIKWVAAITAFIGILTHCNVEMRFGWLSYIFNTPGLHRWHHSKDLREGNKNYGENVMIWDLIFGTYYDASHRPPANIGIKEHMPVRFRQQIIWPFLTNKKRKNIEFPGNIDLQPILPESDIVLQAAE